MSVQYAVQADVVDISQAVPLSADCFLVDSNDAQTVNAALNRLQTAKVDGYDLFILEAMRNHGVAQVITDDGDFATVHGIQVFTANRNVIMAAKVQGRLISR